jgi:DNA processing protein
MAGSLDPRDPRQRGRVLAWLALQDLGALRPREAARALAAAREPRAAAAALARASAASPAPATELEARAERLAAAGARLLPLDAPGYPPHLRRLADPPPVLCLRGEPLALARPAVALVGARRASAAGRELARRLAHDLAAGGLAVISGLARGIDGAAHRGALEAGGISLAVLGCGIDVAYPREHAGLASEVAERGVVLTELPPGAPPLPHHFPLRNRLISALASAVVVVEARERSGSLITAEHAAEQGVDVLAMPGPVLSGSHLGSNRLLRDGAGVVLEANDVRLALGLAPLAPAVLAAECNEALPPLARQGLAALREEPRTPDELARHLGRPVHEVGAAIVQLELAGRIAREPDGRLVARVAG